MPVNTMTRHRNTHRRMIAQHLLGETYSVSRSLLDEPWLDRFRFDGTGAWLVRKRDAKKGCLRASEACILLRGSKASSCEMRSNSCSCSESDDSM